MQRWNCFGLLFLFAFFPVFLLGAEPLFNPTQLFNIGLEFGWSAEAIDFSSKGVLGIAYKKENNGNEGLIQILNPENGAVLSRALISFTLKQLIFSPDGNAIAVHGGSQNVFVCNSENLIRKWSYVATKDIRFIAFSQDGSQLLVGLSDGHMQLLNAETGDLETSYELEGSPVIAGASKDNVVVALHEDGRVFFYNHEGQQLQRNALWIGTRESAILQFCMDSNYFAHFDESTGCFSVFKQNPDLTISFIYRTQMEGFLSPSLALSKSGQYVAASTATADDILILGVEEKKHLQSLKAPFLGAKLAFSHDDNMLAAVFGRRLQIWEKKAAVTSEQGSAGEHGE